MSLPNFELLKQTFLVVQLSATFNEKLTTGTNPATRDFESRWKKKLLHYHSDGVRANFGNSIMT